MLTCKNILADNIEVYPVNIGRAKPGGTEFHLLDHYFELPLRSKERHLLMEEIALYLEDKSSGTVYSFFEPVETSQQEKNWQLCCCSYNPGKVAGQGEVLVFHYQLQLLKDLKSKLYHVLEAETFFKKNMLKVSALTRGERNIIALLCTGMNSKEISEHSYTSIHTVKTHRRNINEKLGIHTLAELMRLADAFDLTPNHSSA